MHRWGEDDAAAVDSRCACFLYRLPRLGRKGEAECAEVGQLDGVAIEEHFLNLLENSFCYCSYVGSRQGAVGSDIVANLVDADGGITNWAGHVTFLVKHYYFLLTDL